MSEKPRVETKPTRGASLALALSFLTTLPAPVRQYDPRDWNGAAWWFPVIGLVIGGGLAVGGWAAGLIFPTLLAAALLVAVWATLTGGLHLDGLADCCDGLWTMGTPERRLRILKEAQLGAFGSLGLALFLILKVTAVAAVLGSGRFYGLLLGPVVARWLILPTARQPAARPGGMGDDFAQNVRPSMLLWAALLPLALIIGGGWRAVAASLLAGLVAAACIAFARRRLGGVTGDVYGLVVETAELAVLLVYAAQLPA